MYFILKNDIDYDSELYIKEPKGLPVEFDLISGIKMTTAIETPLAYTTNARKGDKLRAFLDCSYTLMSSELLSLFKEAGVDNLQTFPAIVKSTEDGHIWDNYYGVNILGLISCADLSKSTYSELMPGCYEFEELAIDSSKTMGTLLFRLQENSATIIMHKNVGKHIMERDPDETLEGWTVDSIVQ